jgi:hypothetical protein
VQQLPAPCERFGMRNLGAIAAVQFNKEGLKRTTAAE